MITEKLRKDWQDLGPRLKDAISELNQELSDGLYRVLKYGKHKAQDFDVTEQFDKLKSLHTPFIEFCKELFSQGVRAKSFEFSDPPCEFKSFYLLWKSLCEDIYNLESTLIYDSVFWECQAVFICNFDKSIAAFKNVDAITKTA